MGLLADSHNEFQTNGDVLLLDVFSGGELSIVCQCIDELPEIESQSRDLERDSCGTPSGCQRLSLAITAVSE